MSPSLHITLLFFYFSPHFACFLIFFASFLFRLALFTSLAFFCLASFTVSLPFCFPFFLFASKRNEAKLTFSFASKRKTFCFSFALFRFVEKIPAHPIADGARAKQCGDYWQCKGKTKWQLFTVQGKNNVGIVDSSWPEQCGDCWQCEARTMWRLLTVRGRNNVVMGDNSSSTLNFKQEGGIIDSSRRASFHTLSLKGQSNESFYYLEIFPSVPLSPLKNSPFCLCRNDLALPVINAFSLIYLYIWIQNLSTLL